MAIVGQKISVLGDILKIYYLGPVREQLNNSTPLMKRIKRNVKDVSGKQANIPIHITRNVTVGARQDATALQAAGKQAYDTATVKTKYQYGRIEITGPTIRASREDRGSFLKIVDSEIKGVTRDLSNDINRQLHGDGSGRLCKVTSTGTASPLTVTTMGTKGPQWKNIQNLMYDNMPINVLDVTWSATYHGATSNTGCMLVNAMTSSTSLPFDQDTAITSTGSGDWVTKNLSGVQGGTTGSCVEMQGLRGLVDDGNINGETTASHTFSFIQGINANTVTEWRAKVLENSSAGTNRALDLDLMQQAFDYAEVGEGSNISIIITSAGIRRKYVDLLRADRRFVKEMTLDGGFKAVEYNTVPIVVDRMANNYNMYFLDESTFQIYQMSDFDWMDEDGAVLSRVSGYDAYEAVLYWYAELGVTRRNANVRLADISETELSATF